MRTLLFAACAASFLAAGVVAAVDSSGENSCGIATTWSVGSGQTFECCTDSSKGSVKGFEYKVERARGQSKGRWGTGTHADRALTALWQQRALKPNRLLLFGSSLPSRHTLPRHVSFYFILFIVSSFCSFCKNKHSSVWERVYDPALVGGRFADNIKFEVKGKSTAWTPTTDSVCDISSNGGTCTGDGCTVEGSIPPSSTSTRCDQVGDIVHEPQRDICVVATCNNPSGGCSDARVTVTFTHESDGNSLADLLDMRAAIAACPDVCTSDKRPYVGKCGAITKVGPGAAHTSRNQRDFSAVESARAPCFRGLKV